MAAVLFYTVIYFVFATPLAIGLTHLMPYCLSPRVDREVWKSGAAEGSTRSQRCAEGLVRTNPFTVVAHTRNMWSKVTTGWFGRWRDAGRLPKRFYTFMLSF